MTRTLILFFCFTLLSVTSSTQSLDVKTIFEKVDSVYSNFQTHECFIETQMWNGENSEVLNYVKKVHLEKIPDTPQGIRFHISSFTSNRTTIYDGKHTTFINHNEGTYFHFKDKFQMATVIGNSTYLSFFKENFIKNLIESESLQFELLPDTIIQNLLCFQIKIIEEYDKELGYYNEYYYFIQKGNFYCKGLRIKKYSIEGPVWQEMLTLEASVNKKVKKDLFKYRQHIRTYYKKMDVDKPRPKKLIKLGKKVPKFESFTLDNKEFSRENLINKITIIDFWYFNCPPCKKATPVLDSLARSYPDSRIQVISMNPFDSKEVIQNYANKKTKAIQHLLVSEKIANKFKITSYPSFYIIDQNGKVAFSKNGFDENLYNDLSTEIEKLLNNDR